MSIEFRQFEREVNEKSDARLKAIHRTLYHWQIHGGAQLVEFWPSKMKMYATSIKKAKVGTVADAISLAGIPDHDPVDNTVNLVSQESLAKEITKVRLDISYVAWMSLFSLIIGIVALILASVI